MELKVEDAEKIGAYQAASVSVEFASETRADVLAVPISALFALPGGGYAVEVVTGAKTEYRDVKLGTFGRQRNSLMVAPTKVSGDLRPGVDQAPRQRRRLGRAPDPDIYTFRIFIGGLSGEFVELKDDAGKDSLKDAKGEPIILRKTLQLTFH